MLFDDLLENHIGGFGKFQILMLCLLGFEEFFIGLQTLAPIFIAATPKDYWCKHPQLYNETIFGNCSLKDRLRMTVPNGRGSDVNSDGLSQCLVYDVTYSPGSCDSMNGSDLHITTNVSHYDVISCTEGWIYDLSVFSSTLITEWDLVCGVSEKAKAKSIASVFLAGRAVGNFIFGWAADRFGRRIILMTAGVASVTVSLATAFIPSYLPFVCARFFQAVLATGKTNTGFVMAMEFSGPSQRVVIGSLYFEFFDVGWLILVGAAYLIRDWRQLQIAISVPEYLAYIIFFFMVPESARWLYANDRRDEADQIVRKVAAINKRKLPDDLVIKVEQKDHSVTPLDLVLKANIRRTTFILFFVWSSCGLVYYGLNFSTHLLGANIFMTTLIFGMFEIPAILIIIVLFKYCGRIPSMIGGMLLGGLCMFTTITFNQTEDWYWAHLITAMFGKFWVTMVFTGVWTYCGECYPTQLRSMGITVTAIGARIFSPLGPYVLMLAAYYDHLPSLIFGTLAIMSAVIIIWLPETRGRHMPQTISEGEQFIKDNMINLPCCQRHRSKHSTSNTDVGSMTPELKLKFLPKCAHQSEVDTVLEQI